MSTNYTASRITCEWCQNEHHLFIGVSSVGWPFLFRVHRNLDHPDTGEFFDLASYDDWKEYLTRSDVTIEDGYGEGISAEDLFTLIDSKGIPEFSDRVFG